MGRIWSTRPDTMFTPWCIRPVGEIVSSNDSCIWHIWFRQSLRYSAHGPISVAHLIIGHGYISVLPSKGLEWPLINIRPSLTILQIALKVRTYRT